jgi:hypothetical protein
MRLLSSGENHLFLASVTHFLSLFSVDASPGDASIPHSAGVSGHRVGREVWWVNGIRNLSHCRSLSSTGRACPKRSLWAVQSMQHGVSGSVTAQ